MTFFLQILGAKGITTIIGMIVFVPIFKNAQKLFDWVEGQTVGTRTYIMGALEKLFITIPEQRITYFLIGISIFCFTSMVLFLGIFFDSWALGIFLGLLLSFISIKLPKPILEYMIEKRIEAYQSQMVDALTLLANGIRAGLSMPQALGMVANELPKPTSDEYNMILQQQRIGVPLEECLENFAKRIPTQDNEMFVTSVNILKETGGNLAEVFDTIIIVIRERIRLVQKIQQYTASGMFQGMTIAAMPYGIGFIYYLTDPKSMEKMFVHPLGIIMMVAAVLLDGIGFFVILKIVKIKI